LNSHRLHLYFVRDILGKNYEICDNSLSVTSRKAKKIWNKCDKQCQHKCKSYNFETKVETIENSLNKTILKIKPQRSPRIVYIKTLKIDFDRLIYNCGGIVGL
jgi:hypothetical protein